jgi:GGDEF domain-containing protein
MQQARQFAPLSADTRESFELAQQERSMRRREGRRQPPPPSTVTAPAEAEGGQVPTWAQNIVLKKHPQPVAAEVAAVAGSVQPVVETTPPVAGVQPVVVRSAESRRPIAQPVIVPIMEQSPAQPAAVVPGLKAGSTAEPCRIENQETLHLDAVAIPAAATQPIPSSIFVTGDALRPRAGLAMEGPVFEIADSVVVEAPSDAAAAVVSEEPIGGPIAEIDAPVVRIRVLSDTDVLPMDEGLELALPADEDEQGQPVESMETALPVAAMELIMETEAPEPVLPVAQLETEISVEQMELELPGAIPAPAFAAGPLEPAVASLESSTAIPEPILPMASEPRPLVTPQVEVRSNVVQMPVTPVARHSGPIEPATAELALPSGFQEASTLARLLEDEAPFNGLALVISVVDYVRLMADQGKPAVEQLMGSVCRLVVSLAREQDFACRISEDEFVLLFGHETGAGAKRRIQLVSERLWDFQLRSLGSVSVIFSWGASESAGEPVVHAVEHAREQMLESRRNRRALASGVGRFRRRIANS